MRSTDYYDGRVEGMRTEREAIVAWLRSSPCPDPAHHPAWCETCNVRAGVADAIERGEYDEEVSRG